jgi:hypothetical protein
MRQAALLLLLPALAACGEARGWRGNMTGDYRQVALCAADGIGQRHPALPILREDQRIAIIAGPVRDYEARLQETSPRKFFAELRQGSETPAGRAAWAAIQGCAAAGPDRIWPPGNGQFDPALLAPSG